ncbi:MAG: hypothetical protein J5793_03615 [Clostridia bacterium]|nr:hypothetical protein [Clostridia bacterium]
MKDDDKLVVSDEERLPTLPERIEKKEPSRFSVYMRRFFAQFGTAIIATAIVAYIFLQLMLNVGTMLDIETATYTSVVRKDEIPAYLFRNEVVIESEAGGTDCFLAEDGEKVKKGQNIAVTYENAADAEKQKRINEIDARIEVLRKSSLADGESTTNISLIDDEIKSVTLDIVRNTERNALDKATRDKDKLVILLNRRAALVNSISYAAEMSKLYEERSALAEGIAGDSFYTPAPKSGYFYSQVDGYENVFTIKTLDSLTAETFETLSGSVADENLISASSGKIVIGSTWYIAVAIDKKTGEKYKDGGVCPITFQYSNNTVLNMTVERRINRTDADITILILSTKVMPEGFDYSRCQTVELSVNEYKGLRISTSSVRVVDGQTGVYVVLGSRVVFKTTTILYTYGGYCICEIPKDEKYPDESNISYNSKTRLSLNDSVIINGTDIYDGMRIK